MSAERVVVRRARAGDAPARAAVLRDAHAANNTEAFLYFFFHETTLQAVLLCGAVLFIFCGCGPAALAALPALAAAGVLLAVRTAHELAAARQARLLARETAGWVAERRGPPRPPAAAPHTVHIDFQQETEAEGSGGGGTGRAALVGGGGRAALVGTVSLSECRDAAGAWLHALAVARAWQRRGVGRALEAAARRGAARACRCGTLHAVASALQPGARALLHDAGWQCAGAYARPLLGTALALPLARLQCDVTAPA